MYDDVEEIKPGLFIKKSKKGKYRQIHPILKDIRQPLSFNNIYWYNTIIGPNIMSWILMGLLLFSAYAYSHDLKECFDVLENPPECGYVGQGNLPPGISDINLSDLNLDNGRSKDIPIPP